MTMTINDQRVGSGISSALHVPVPQRIKDGESALFQGVVWRNHTPALKMCGLLQQRGTHHCGDWRQSVLFIWSVSIVYLNQIDQTDQMNQINVRCPVRSIARRVHADEEKGREASEERV